MNGKEFSKEIAAALADASISEPQLTELIRACEPRREQIRARIRECQPGPGESTAERDKALRIGADALKALDDEAADLRRELEYIDAMEWELSEARERVIEARIRRDGPKAYKSVPTAIARVRKAREALEAAVCDANQFIDAAAAYDSLEKRKTHLADDELADLIELRNSIWNPPRLSVLMPPIDPLEGGSNYPRSSAAFFERRGDLVRIRRPGNPPWASDMGDPVTRVKLKG